MAESITFERVIGQVARSILFSPDRYRNKIVFPKDFDRVFCVLVDNNDWRGATLTRTSTIIPQAEDDLLESAGLSPDETVFSSDTDCRPEYYQYSVTTSIMTDVDLEEMVPYTTSQSSATTRNYAYADSNKTAREVLTGYDKKVVNVGSTSGTSGARTFPLGGGDGGTRKK